MIICFIADAKSINTINWVKELAQKHTVHVISFRDNAIENVTVHNLSYIEFIGKLNYFFAIRNTKRIIKSIKPDIINGYYISSYGLLARMVGFRPLILTVAGSDIFKGFLSSRLIFFRFIMKLLLKYILNGSDMIICWTDVMKERVKILGGKQNNIFVMPRGIDLSLFRNYENRKALNTKIKIIHTRSLKEIYNIPLVLKIICKLKEINFDIELLIVGDGPLKNTLKLEVNNLGINDSVKFIGSIPYSDIPKILKQCDFYFSMSSSDGASSSLFEAMACGLFPVVSAIEANKIWIKDNENGLLVEFDEIDTIAEKILMAYNDQEFFNRAISINKDIVKKHFSGKKNLKKIENEIVNCAKEFKKMRS